MENAKKTGFKLPSSYTIILMIIVIIAIMTHFVSGVTPARLSDIVNAPVQGFVKGVSVILFILVIGGYLKIINDTGILETGIAKIVRKAKGKEIYLIPILMFLFSLGGTTYGMAEETLAFYPLVIATMLACGFDVITGVATILLGMFCGVSGSTINPFSIGTAVDALKTATGIEANQAVILIIGSIIWLSSVTMSSIFVMNYAKKVKKDKRFSILSEEETRAGEAKFANKDGSMEEVSLNYTGKMKLTLGLFAFSFVVMIMALIPWEDYGITFFNGWTSFLTGLPFGEWYYNDLSVWFIIMAVIIGKINGLTEKIVIKTFIKGAGELVSVAMIVGFSKGISVIMSNTGLDAFLLQAGTSALSGVPTGLFSGISYAIYTGLTMLIPSTSGLASASIPTFGALTSSLGFAPEVMISIYIGSHFIVGMVPTAGVVMSALSMSKIEFPTWVKFYGKLYIMITIVNIVVLSAAMTIL